MYTYKLQTTNNSNKYGLYTALSTNLSRVGRSVGPHLITCMASLDTYMSHETLPVVKVGQDVTLVPVRRVPMGVISSLWCCNLSPLFVALIGLIVSVEEEILSFYESFSPGLSGQDDECLQAS